MNKYGTHSKKVHGEITRTLQVLFGTVLERIDHSLVCGRRGAIEQEEAFKKGLTTKHFPNSKHNMAIPVPAVDSDPYPLKKGAAGKEQSIYFAGYVQGVSDMLFKMGETRRRTRNLGQTSLGDWRHTEEL